MLDVRPGDLTMLDSTDRLVGAEVVTVMWVRFDTAGDGIPLAKCIGPRGELASCTHRVRNPGTRLLHGERR